MARIIVFDDGRGMLSPLTDLRAAFDVRTGAFTLVERLTRALGCEIAALVVPGPLAGVTREHHRTPVNAPPAAVDGPVIAVNGRCTLPDERTFELTPGQAVVEAGSGDLICACLAPGALGGFIGALDPGASTVHEAPAGALLNRPWDTVAARDRTLEFDLTSLTDHDAPAVPEHAIEVGESPLVVMPSATIYPAVTFDLERGPVFVDEHATVRPLSVVCGPAYIGPHSTVLDRAVIRPGTSLGPWCKAAGEIAGTIFQGYSNKAHDGFIGDSWVGEWVNLGAGTTNSNLLNTYGEVVARAAPDAPHERTGRQFLGAVIGDHVKTAICTRIMTGSVIHTGAMIASTAGVSGCVGRFSWCTDGGVRPYRTEKFIEVARAVTARRGVTLSGAHEARLRALAQGDSR